MDGLATHGERLLQPHTQLQEKSISRRVVEFSMDVVFGDHHLQVIQDLSQHRPARFHPLFCGRRALSSGKEAVCLPSDLERERFAPGINSPHWCLDCGEPREGSIQERPWRLCSWWQSDEVAKRCILHPASARLRKTFLPVGRRPRALQAVIRQGASDAYLLLPVPTQCPKALPPYLPGPEGAR
jgi:hypothetical protein